METTRDAQPPSAIAQERVAPGKPRPAFLGAVAVLAMGACGLALYAGLQPRGPFPVESLAGGNPGSLFFPLGQQGARVASALCAGAAVAAVAFAARRLFHADAVGLLAGALVATDPGFLAAARLATPALAGLAALCGALLAFLVPSPRAHWVGAGLLAVATLMDPRSVLWGVPLGLLVLLRGHIYAASRHVATALLQTVAASLAGFLLHVFSTDGAVALLPCETPPGPALLLLHAPVHVADGAAVAVVHNPITWFGGMGALLFLAGGTLRTVLKQVQVARLPGRLQLRLAQGLPGAGSRILWLLLLVAFAPSGLAWGVLFAVALAAGIGALSEDAPGFGLALSVAAVLFAALALVRGWAAVAGVGDVAGAAGTIVPWGTLVACP